MQTSLLGKNKGYSHLNGRRKQTQKKILFSLMAGPLPPPLLMARPLNQELLSL